MDIRKIVMTAWLKDHRSLMGADARSLEAVVLKLESSLKVVGWRWEYMGDIHFSVERPSFSETMETPTVTPVYEVTP